MKSYGDVGTDLVCRSGCLACQSSIDVIKAMVTCMLKLFILVTDSLVLWCRLACPVFCGFVFIVVVCKYCLISVIL